MPEARVLTSRWVGGAMLELAHDGVSDSELEKSFGRCVETSARRLLIDEGNEGSEGSETDGRCAEKRRFAFA